METVLINEFIVLLAFDNENNFFREVKGDDRIAVLNYTYESFEKQFDRNKSYLSIMESSILGSNTIENSKDKIFSEVNRLSIDKKHFIVRYKLPDVTPVYADIKYQLKYGGDYIVERRMVGVQTVTIDKWVIKSKMDKLEQIEKYISGCRDFAIKKQLNTINNPSPIEIKTDVGFYKVEENIYKEILDEISRIKKLK